MQRKEENRFLKNAIILIKDKHTEMAKAEDNPYLFKETVNKKDVLKHQQKRSIVQSAHMYVIHWKKIRMAKRFI